MLRVNQHFDNPRVQNLERTLLMELQRESIRSRVCTGDRVAIAVGSRGIADLQLIVRTLVHWVKGRGAQPFIVPAMGSHGGATAEGQEAVLALYGITEEGVGAPVVSSMDVCQVGSLASGVPVFFDKTAYQADVVIPVNRIKLHTDFRGEVESGLVKMLCIGLGKHKGTTTLHSQGMDLFDRIIPEAGAVILRNSPVKFGVAVLENARDEVARLVAVEAEQMIAREKDLLKEATALMMKILFPQFDLLIIDEMGKDISGDGIDPNVIRRGLPRRGEEGSEPQRIVVLSLTKKTKGNAFGIGLADITTQRLADMVSFEDTYTNAITNTVIHLAKMPLVMPTDRDAIAVALNTCARVKPLQARVIHIKNTLSLTNIRISESLRQQAQELQNVEICGEATEMSFNADGALMST
ncbi:MAG: lactate racemase domain-containing protein [Bacillota bacterium]